MAGYDELVTYWGQLSPGTTTASIQSAIETINTRTIAGPAVNVPAVEVAGYFAANAKLSTLESYATSGTNPLARTAAAEFIAVIGIAGMSFGMTDPAVYTAVQNFMEALASDSATGINASDVTNVMALANPQILWVTADISVGGAGLSSLINSWDLSNAGVISPDQAEVIG